MFNILLNEFLVESLEILEKLGKDVAENFKLEIMKNAFVRCWNHTKFLNCFLKAFWRKLWTTLFHLISFGRQNFTC